MRHFNSLKDNLKNNPRRFLKIPNGLYAIAKELGILNDVIFYYELKCMTINGAFRRGEIIDQINTRFNYSSSAIRKKLRRLVDLRWVSSQKGNYTLKAYDVVFTSLGYDISKLKLIKADVRKIIFHPKHNLNPCTIKDILMLNEITCNLKRQERSIRLLPHGLHTDKQNINVATLSCEGVSKLLGYKSITQGWYIEQRLKELQLISVKNRKIFKGPRSSFGKIPKKCFEVRGNVIRQLANEIKIV